MLNGYKMLNVNGYMRELLPPPPLPPPSTQQQNNTVCFRPREKFISTTEFEKKRQHQERKKTSLSPPFG